MPEREGCKDCGASLEGRGKNAIVCEDCRVERRRSAYRKSQKNRNAKIRAEKKKFAGSVEGKEKGYDREYGNSPQCALRGCQNRIPLDRLRNGAKYCNRSHATTASSRAAQTRKKADRDAEKRLNDVVQSPTARQGDAYRALMDDDNSEIRELFISNKVEASYVANVLGFSISAVLRARQAVVTTLKFQELQKGWKPYPHVAAMLPQGKLLALKEMGPSQEDTPEFQNLVDDLVRAYSVFSRFFFTLEGNRPLVENFHLIWIRLIIVAYATGGKQMILSPPRHGKSEMLIRFAVWMIVMFPNIRIMWVAANTDVAKIMLGAVKDHLANNEKLVKLTLPPGNKYKPKVMSGNPWSGKEIKVEQQDIVGQKSSSMLALGRTSKILSRDVDLLIVDDMEDFDTTREARQRVYSRNKLAEIGTRKEERTAEVVICSRQHPDDIPQHIMGMDPVLGWRVHVDAAHQECDLDPDIVEGHDGNGCVLFPRVRSYRWLMEKKLEMDALGIPGAYEMRYLNKPVPESGMVFDIPLIRERALDRSRGIGTEGLPQGRLVAGLDPAARGTQAGFCWHYSNDNLSMVDLEAQKAGGFAGAHFLMEDWNTRYGLTDWFYEDNSQQVEFFNDPRTKDLARRLGLTIRVHTTGKNKQDAELGISSMAPWYHDGHVNLPYGTAEARKKTNMLLNQLELWTVDGVKTGKHALTDIKMASWFPFPTIIKWGNNDRKVTLHLGHENSYPEISGFGTAPWQNTIYPGG